MKTLELEKKRSNRKKLLWKHSAQTPEEETGSLFSITKADDSEWVNINIMWIIYEQGRLLCLWMVMIYKYTENRNLALFPKPSSLKPSICRNNIHSSLKTNKQTKQLLLPNPSNVTVHQILSIRSFKAQLKICFLCAFYWLSVLPMHSAYCHIL